MLRLGDIVAVAKLLEAEVALGFPSGSQGEVIAGGEGGLHDQHGVGHDGDERACLAWRKKRNDETIRDLHQASSIKIKFELQIQVHIVRFTSFD